MERFVIYTRVSTKAQGKSGLGLEAQQRDINLYLQHYTNTPYEVLDCFQDIKSGAKENREQLTAAIHLAKKSKAILLVSKLDRLSRDIHFVTGLMKDKALHFRVATLPSADKMMLLMYALVAEIERDFISTRTRAALQVAKKRGVVLGGRRAKAAARHKAVKADADANALRVVDTIKAHRQEGKTYADIAEILNSMNVPTARGGKWYDTTVRRYEKRLAVEVVKHWRKSDEVE